MIIVIKWFTNSTFNLLKVYTTVENTTYSLLTLMVILLKLTSTMRNVSSSLLFFGVSDNLLIE